MAKTYSLHRFDLHARPWGKPYERPLNAEEAYATSWHTFRDVNRQKWIDCCQKVHWNLSLLFFLNVIQYLMITLWYEIKSDTFEIYNNWCVFWILVWHHHQKCLPRVDRRTGWPWPLTSAASQSSLLWLWNRPNLVAFSQLPPEWPLGHF